MEGQAGAHGEMPLEELAAALYALADLVDTDSLASWNDDPARSQAEVLRTLEHAARTYEEPRGRLKVSSN